MIYRLCPSARLALAFALLALVAFVGVVLTHPSRTVPPVIRVTSVDELQRIFAQYDYSLPSVRRTGSVPPLSISEVPAGWEASLDTAARKQVFFESVLPLVLIANERIAEDRKRLHRLSGRLDKNQPLPTNDNKWLGKLAATYGIDWPAATDGDAARQRAMAALKRRVGPIPPSLALSQAAVESAYGTSRFATTGNALFGQWTRAKGLVPKEQRASKSDWTVARFASPLGSVEAYLRNLNTHNAYRGFRLEREKLGGIATGAALAPTVASYSEKGADYTRLLRDIIRVNGLDALDDAKLASERPIRLLIP
jgi:Bax protein